MPEQSSRPISETSPQGLYLPKILGLKIEGFVRKEFTSLELKNPGTNNHIAHYPTTASKRILA